MSETPETLTPRQLAQRLGFKAHYGNQLAKEGRFVFAPDGKNVLVNESIQRFHATKDPAKQAVADRHAAARAEAASVDDDDQSFHAEDEPSISHVAVGNSYQQARAVKEKFLALEAKRAYELAIGQLRDAQEVEGLAATAMTELRLRLEALATTVAPMLTNQTDETKVRAMLQDQFAHALESASHHFAKLASGSRK